MRSSLLAPLIRSSSDLELSILTEILTDFLACEGHVLMAQALKAVLPAPPQSLHPKERLTRLAASKTKVNRKRFPAADTGELWERPPAARTLLRAFSGPLTAGQAQGLSLTVGS